MFGEISAASVCVVVLLPVFNIVGAYLFDFYSVGGRIDAVPKSFQIMLLYNFWYSVQNTSFIKLGN